VGFHGFFISGCESMTNCPIPTEVEYWNDYAPWYQRWRTHNDYHGSIIEELKRRVRPGWRVLDIGAADGALGLPLSQWGCRVTALEPAQRLREDLTAEGRRLEIPGLAVSNKTWEEYSGREGEPYDLVVACNSLHLTAGGFRKALAKIIALRPRWVLVVAEAEATGLFILNQPGYSLRDFQAYETDSHFAYHAPSEAVDHWQACYGVRPSPEERRRLFQRLCFEDGHWWLKERVTVRMFYWKKVEMF
jgi:SAM-dependent methyltransferase